LKPRVGQKSFDKKDTSAGPPTIRAQGRGLPWGEAQQPNPPVHDRSRGTALQEWAEQGNNLSYQGQVMMENRNDLVTGTRLTLATGTAEQEVDMVQQIALRDGHCVSVGADEAYDTHDFVRDLR